MNKDKTILLQKQIKDNSEDLQKELLDLKNWERDMKRKEAELLNAGGDQINVLPPIRSKKKKTIESSPPIASTSKSGPERIKSSDYTAWDKFDVDAAIRKLDEEEESDGSTEDLQQTAEKKHADATKCKEQGNIFVKKKLYEKAIECYSEAIKLFPYDEVFYANRALCYLKIDNLYSAEADCTAALQLNDCYVKAYHRRATARMALEQYIQAKKDIERMLELEPTNKEANSMLAQVNKKLQKSKSVIISGSTSPEPSVEKEIGEKVWNATKLKEQTAIQKQLMHDFKKVKEDSKSTRLTITEIPNDSESTGLTITEIPNDSESTGLTLTEIPNDSEQKQSAKSREPKITEIPSDSEQKLIEGKLPDWLPKLDDDFSIVKPVQISPHLRSQKPLKRIPIQKADFENNILPKYEKDSKEVEKPKIDEKPITSKIVEISKETEKPKEDSTKIEETKAAEKQISDKKPEELIKPSVECKPGLRTSPSILERLIRQQEQEEERLKMIEKAKSHEIFEIVEEKPAPTTSVQFLMDWKRNKSMDYRYLYFKQIPPETIPSVFKDSMESDIFGDIICVLKEKFTSTEKNVFQYLKHLSNIKRFRTLIMFMERSTKEALKELFTHCKTQEGKSEEEIDELRKKYEL